MGSEAEPDAGQLPLREPGPPPAWGHGAADIPPLPPFIFQLAKREHFMRSGKGGK